MSDFNSWCFLGHNTGPPLLVRITGELAYTPNLYLQAFSSGSSGVYTLLSLPRTQNLTDLGKVFDIKYLSNAPISQMRKQRLRHL